MTDELDEHVRRLSAERERPKPTERSLPPIDPGPVLAELVAALHSLYTTPPDKETRK